MGAIRENNTFNVLGMAHGREYFIEVAIIVIVVIVSMLLHVIPLGIWVIVNIQ